MNNFKNLGKRVLSLFIALVMCVSLIPGAALAAEEGACEHSNTRIENLENGHHATVCQDCGKAFNESFHNWTRTPTYESPAQKWTCTDCGETVFNDVILKPTEGHGAGHSHIRSDNRNLRTKTVAPTCTESGYSEVWCVFCATRIEGPNEIAPIGHTPEVIPAILRTCTTEGFTEGSKCSVCGEILNAPVSTGYADHNYMVVEGKPATCNEPGLRAHQYCNGEGNCGKYWECREDGTRGAETSLENLTIPATGNHTYGEWITDEDEHTDPLEGRHWKACTVCGARTDEGLHYKATLTTTDTEEIWTCVCGVEVQKNGHSFQWEHTDTQHWQVCVNASCTKETEKGSHTFGTTYDQPDTTHHSQTCTVCGAVVTTDHDFSVNNTCACGVQGPGTEPENPDDPECKHTIQPLYRNNGDGTHDIICGNAECKKVLKKSVQHVYDKNSNTECVCGAKKPTDPTPEHWHALNTVPAKAATCTEDGNIEHLKCADPECGKLFAGTATNPGKELTAKEVVIKAAGHKTTRIEYTAPTCTVNGVKAHSECTVCGKCFVSGTDLTEIEHPTIPATGHKAADDAKWNMDVTSHWKVCGHVNNDESCTEKVQVAEHTYGEWETKTEASMTAPGTKVRTCTVCGYKEEAPISQIGHSYNRELSKDETHHWNDGCACGEKHNVEEHLWNNPMVIKEATCTTVGEQQTRCLTCGYVKTEEIPLTAHAEVIDEAVAATCTTPGKTEGSHCSVCNTVLVAQEPIEAKGHAYDEGVITNQPTCTGDGVKTFTCTRPGCGHTYTEAVTSDGHLDVVDVEAVAPTCTKPGHTAGKYCNACQVYTEATTEIPATGHTVANDAAVAATCTATGLTAGSHCSVCEEVLTAQTTIPALGHSAVSYANVAATCTTSGYTGGSYCSRCNTVLTTRTTVPATGHAWNAGVITTYPTYYSTGLRTYTCTTCSATRTETIPQLTYTYDPGYNTPDPEPDDDPDYEPPVSSNRQPTTTIPDDNTPLGNTPNTPGTVTIEDEDTPLANRPLPFIDVKNGDWFRPYVSYVFHKGMMTGMSDTLFGPDVSTTRGMIVTIIYRMENASASGVSPFTDVESDEYYADPIAWASANGVVLGYSETLFGPKDNITREQMAAILYRYCVNKGIDVANYGDLSRFPDGDKVSDYAVEAMRWAVDRGLIAGLDDGRLDPTGTATRAQVATILNRFCEMIGA